MSVKNALQNNRRDDGLTPHAVNNLEIDQEGELQPYIDRFIAGEVEEGKGALTERVFANGRVLKRSKYDNTPLRLERVVSNIITLRDIGIDLANGTVGEYEIEGEEETVLLQTEADRTYQETLEAGEATWETDLLLEGAIEATDLAYEAGVEIDNSLDNFGLFSNYTAMIDYHDDNSVDRNPEQEDLEEMYDALITSARQSMPQERAERMVRECSRFYSEL